MFDECCFLGNFLRSRFLLFAPRSLIRRVGREHADALFGGSGCRLSDYDDDRFACRWMGVRLSESASG